MLFNIAISECQQNCLQMELWQIGEFRVMFFLSNDTILLKIGKHFLVYFHSFTHRASLTLVCNNAES